jgi:ferredoxin-NADP reductase
VIRRAYSIASPPQEQEQIDLCLKLVPGGTMTTWVWNFQEGIRIQVHGPFGKFVLPFEVEQDLVFIATGTGVAPFRSMIRDLLHKGFQKNIWLLFGTRYDRSIPYDEEWRLLASHYPQLHYIPTVSRPSAEWKGETGYVQTKIADLFPQPDGKLVYICGLNQMIQAVQEECLRQGFPKESIRYERFD